VHRGALLVLLFSSAAGLYWAGVVSTFVMALGQALTVSAIAAIAVGSRAAGAQARQKATRLARHDRRDAQGGRRGAADAGSGLTLFWGTLQWRGVGRLMPKEPRQAHRACDADGCLSSRGRPRLRSRSAMMPPLRFGRFEADGQVRYGVLSRGRRA
jgi:hypothetical protein